jgi:enoyl-[acyl-carrier protein] reductase/trans-2-enoyl-CoA reductase (NAD+)
MGEPLEVLGLGYKSGELEPIRVEVADALAVENTVRVMGGDDLEMWVSALLYSGLAAEGMTVTALSYIGPELESLRRMYWDGALGAAKQHIDATTAALDARVAASVGGKAFTVMNPAVVTAASVAIPAMLRYVSDYLGCDEAGKGVYADPLDIGIDFARALYGEGEPWRGQLDEAGRLRLDGRELEPGLQTTIAGLWSEGQPGPPPEITARGLERFKREYAMLYGWQVEGVDYAAPYAVDPELGEGQRVFDLLG